MAAGFSERCATRAFAFFLRRYARSLSSGQTTGGPVGNATGELGVGPGSPSSGILPASMRAALTLLCIAIACGCRYDSGPDVSRIDARPSPPTWAIEPGLHQLTLGRVFYRGTWRDGTLLIPSRATSAHVPLLVLLHGGGGRASDNDFMQPLAEEYGVALLQLDARHNTWDGIDSPFGPDMRFIDEALRHTFERVPVDPARLALGGMSDGGMYALSVGIANGDLFTHLIAVAPGYIDPPGPPVGRPRIFLAHGTRDNVYSVSGSRTRLLPSLQRSGYDVTYFEFDGPHFITPVAARELLEWLVGTSTS
jgi:phospholipase/carboxylesterase